MSINKMKCEQIIAQIMEFRGKSNGGIIQIILRDGSTVIGLFDKLNNASEDQGGFVELTNGRRIGYEEIERII